MATAVEHGVTEEVEQHVPDLPEGVEPGATSNQEPLFEVVADEDLDISVSNTYDTCRVASPVEEALGTGRISSISSSYGTFENSAEADVASTGSYSDRGGSSRSDTVLSIPEEPEELNEVTEGVNNIEISNKEAIKTRADSIRQLERENSEEDVNDPSWVRHKKHVFVFSDAGKPIYSRYGNEDKLATLMGVMQAIVSFVQDDKNAVRFFQDTSIELKFYKYGVPVFMCTQDLIVKLCVIAGAHKIVYLMRAHIVLVAVAKTSESIPQLQMQLSYVYNQILSVLTYSQLCKIMEQRRNYDLRRLLAGTEKFIDNLLNLMDHEPSFLLGSVRCLPLSSSVRENIGQTMLQARVPDLVFAILVAKNQLVTLIRPKKYSLHPSDLHLIFNLVSASTSFQTAESWTPICLPRFDNSGYLYAHISYLKEECPACLLLLSTDRSAFFELAGAKQKILERFDRYKCLEAINEAVATRSYSTEQVGIPELYHFVYKSKSTAQYTSPELEAPYIDPLEQERLFGLYLYLHQRIHSSSRPLKILCHVGMQEMLLGWVTSGFELYAAFSPLVTKPIAINAINKLLRWIKREEDRLFILNSQVF